jgi:hypothetical protein
MRILASVGQAWRRLTGQAPGPSRPPPWPPLEPVVLAPWDGNVMTEAKWLGHSDPVALLRHVAPQASARKLRLFACAACRRVWAALRDEASRHAVEVAERHADGLASAAELAAAAQEALRVAERAGRHQTPGWNAARTAAAVTEAPLVAAERAAGAAADADLLRDVFGNPFQGVLIDPTWLAWGGGAVRHLAQAIYEERRFRDLFVLADALEEAGCADAAVLDHCRQYWGHARGCWVLDALLGKT